jgi:hypothetical protein
VCRSGRRGLFDLYEFISPEVVERIVQKIVGKMAPPQPPIPTNGRKTPPTRASQGAGVAGPTAPSECSPIPSKKRADGGVGRSAEPK